ncbi:hypothetical protein PTKIN_Ptkin06aG0034000 [Pterospermum kingtungense]
MSSEYSLGGIGIVLRSDTGAFIAYRMLFRLFMLLILLLLLERSLNLCLRGVGFCWLQGRIFRSVMLGDEQTGFARVLAREARFHASPHTLYEFLNCVTGVFNMICMNLNH